jgi:hypothetical protein
MVGLALWHIKSWMAPAKPRSPKRQGSHLQVARAGPLLPVYLAQETGQEGSWGSKGPWRVGK